MTELSRPCGKTSAAKKWARWTDDEDRYLETNYGRTSMARMQSTLQRTANAITRRAVYLDIAKRSEEFGYTVADVALMVGRDRDTVTAWVERRRLQATRRHTGHPRDLWAITARALRTFVLEYPDEVNPGRVAASGGWHLLVDVLANAGHGAGEFGRKERREDMNAQQLEDDE